MIQAQIVGGPRDGEYTSVIGLVLTMIEEQPPLTYLLMSDPAPPIPDWRRGERMYKLQRGDDGQYFYVREPK